MRTIYKWLCVLPLSIMIGFAGCMKKDDISQPDLLKEGDEVEISFSSLIETSCSVQLRGEDEIGITSLKLLVFDENRQFLYSRMANLQQEVPDSYGDVDHLPSGGKGNIEKMLLYKVKLITSTKKRYIHFVANHVWDGFPQDYFLEGKSDGEIIASLATEKEEFWQLIELDGIDKNSLKDKVVKLLRNIAAVSVECETNENDFKFDSFVVYNSLSRGTVAPFKFDEESLHYNFPTDIFEPTEPAVYERITSTTFKSGKKLQKIFEMDNQGESPCFVLVKGYYNGSTAPSYYKIDLKKLDTNTGEVRLYNIIRNRKYIVTLEEVKNKGYATPNEAIENAAGNNLFASVELEGSPSVSDGTDILEVYKLGETYVVAPDVFSTGVMYTKGISNVTLYPSWESGDEYVGMPILETEETDPNQGTISFEIKKTPTDRVITREIKVIGKDTNTGKYMSRKIKVYLRSPYQFDEGINSEGIAQGASVAISFEVPSSISSSVFPFDVYIKTKELTPDETKNKLMIERIDGDYYYKYVVRDETLKGKRIKVFFKRNRSNSGETIELSSKYYKKATVQLANIVTASGKLTEGLEGSKNPYFHIDNDNFEFRMDGKDFSINSLDTQGVKIEIDDWGNYKFVWKKDKLSDPSKELTLVYKYEAPNNYGKASFVCSVTKTLEEWAEGSDHHLYRDSVVIEGQMGYYNGYNYSSVDYANNLVVSSGTITWGDVVNYQYGDSLRKFKLELSGHDAKTTEMISFTYKVKYADYYDIYEGQLDLNWSVSSTLVGLYLK